MKGNLLLACLVCGFIFSFAQQQLARPSADQYAWQEQDRIMFVHFGLAAWQGREYDNHSTPLSQVNPAKLNTDQWCQVAKSWGAKQIIFVAKHVGGFCWWPTNTNDYSVQHTPWRNGRGDLFKELSVSCKKYGLKMGVYIYPGDEKWGAGLGSGGRTSDPSKQEEYNKVYRQQVTEVLTRYGNMAEVWFDGSCIIDVSDLLAKYAKHAVIFQGPQATIRWVGNESGITPYPAWNSISQADAKTGVATAVQGNPDGDVWSPVETDVTLYNHNWFWSKENEKKRRSVGELMEIYYKSSGRGSMMLLNSTPDTNGLIPEGDVKRYAELGKEINRRFSHPLAIVVNKKEDTVQITFASPTTINHAVIMEDYREGERIRAYTVEGLINGQWQKLSDGSAIGRKKIDWFNNTTVSKVRMRVTKSAGTPLVRSFAVYKIDHTPELSRKEEANTDWQYLNSWNKTVLQNGKASISFNLTPFITKPGQYELKFEQDGGKNKLVINSATLLYEGEKTLPEFLIQKGNVFYINRTAQVTNETSSVLNVEISGDGGNDCSGSVYFRMVPLK